MFPFNLFNVYMFIVQCIVWGIVYYICMAVTFQHVVWFVTSWQVFRASRYMEWLQLTVPILPFPHLQLVPPLPRSCEINFLKSSQAVVQRSFKIHKNPLGWWGSPVLDNCLRKRPTSWFPLSWNRAWSSYGETRLARQAVKSWRLGPIHAPSSSFLLTNNDNLLLSRSFASLDQSSYFQWCLQRSFQNHVRKKEKTTLETLVV